MSTFAEQIDAAAEREGAAEAWFEEHLDQPVPTTKLKKARDEALCATARGLPKPPIVKYGHLRAEERWIKICEVFAAGGVVMTIDARFDTRESRVKRQARRAANGFLVPPSWLERSAEMSARLRALSAYHGGELLTAGLAAALAGIPERTCFRMIRHGKIPSVKLRGAGASQYIRVNELREFLSEVVSVAS